MSRRELKGKQVRTMLSTEYIKSDINNIEDKIKNEGRRLPAKAVTPMAQGCHHELDATNELYQDKITTFKELIEILR